MEAYREAADNLVTPAKELAARDPWEACHFASLFSHFGDYSHEYEILTKSADSLPKIPRFDNFRRELANLTEAAAANMALQSKRS
jgi:hypothetical protein